MAQRTHKALANTQPVIASWGKPRHSFNRNRIDENHHRGVHARSVIFDRIFETGDEVTNHDPTPINQLLHAPRFICVALIQSRTFHPRSRSRQCHPSSYSMSLDSAMSTFAIFILGILLFLFFSPVFCRGTFGRCVLPSGLRTFLIILLGFGFGVLLLTALPLCWLVFLILCFLGITCGVCNCDAFVA